MLRILSILSDKFVHFLEEISIDKTWVRVGDCFKDYSTTFGPEKFPVKAFNYWSLINDIFQNFSFFQVLLSEEECSLKKCWS